MWTAQEAVQVAPHPAQISVDARALFGYRLHGQRDGTISAWIREYGKGATHAMLAE